MKINGGLELKCHRLIGAYTRWCSDQPHAAIQGIKKRLIAQPLIILMISFLKRKSYPVKRIMRLIYLTPDSRNVIFVWR